MYICVHIYFLFIYQTCHISGIFGISRIANLQQWIFISLFDDLVMFLGKSEVIFSFSGMKQVFIIEMYLNVRIISQAFRQYDNSGKNILNVNESTSVIRQKGESQNGCYKKTRRAKFFEKRTFLTL